MWPSLPRERPYQVFNIGLSCWQVGPPQKWLKPHWAWCNGAHDVRLTQELHCCCRDTCARCPGQLGAPAGKGSLLSHKRPLGPLRASWEMSVLCLAYLLQDMGSSFSVTALNGPSSLLFPGLLVTNLPSSHCPRIRSEHQAIPPSRNWTTSRQLEVCALTSLTIPKGLAYSSQLLAGADVP